MIEVFSDPQSNICITRRDLMHQAEGVIGLDNPISVVAMKYVLFLEIKSKFVSHWKGLMIILLLLLCFDSYNTSIETRFHCSI